MQHKRFSEPGELKALAHPTRMALLEHLAYRGDMTATQLAELVDESPSNCSWHLRKLAQFGLVERAPGENERDRPWRITFDSYDYSEAAAAGTVPRLVVHRQVERMLQVVAQDGPEPFIWGSNASWLTESEYRSLAAKLREVEDLLGDAEARRRDPARRPEGARLYEMVGWLIPADEVL